MKTRSNTFINAFQQSAELKQALASEKTEQVLISISEVVSNALLNGHKLLLCGNGGSAADAQHIAAEFLIRYRSNVNRRALPAITLNLDSSTLTACGNDFGFDSMYERALEALANPGDVLLALSTSGNSPNILRALQCARTMNLKTIGFLGNDGGAAKNLCNYTFLVPSDHTGRIQESHITAGHALVEYVENKMLYGFSHQFQSILS